MTTDKVRIAVIGIGSWANRVHIPQALSHSGAELAALCARSEDKLKAAGEQFGIQRLFTDYEQLLSAEDIDAVTISTTHNAHYEIAKAALQAGKHVFCEKPLAVNSTQSGELAGLAQDKGVKTMVAFTNRWVPEAIHAKQLLAEGFCGETFHYNVCQLASYGRPGGNWMWRAVPELAGGGVLFDLGCHNIDMALWLNGPIRSVCATLKNTSPQRQKGDELLPTTADDTDAFIAQYESGTQGIFHISWTSTGDRVMRHEIAGREGLLVLNLYHDVWQNRLAGCKAGEADARPLVPPDEIQSTIPRAVASEQERQAAHEAFLLRYPSLVRAFIECILQDTEPTPSFADGHETQKVMDAILQSDRERRWVDVG